MASRFAGSLAEASTDCDDEFGEATRIAKTPPDRGFLVAAQGAWSAPIIAIVSDSGSEAQMRGARANMQDRGDIEISLVSASYSLSRLAAAGLALARGDVIEFSERPGAPTYKVADLDADGFGHVTAILRKI